MELKHHAEVDELKNELKRVRAQMNALQTEQLRSQEEQSSRERSLTTADDMERRMFALAEAKRVAEEDGVKKVTELNKQVIMCQLNSLPNLFSQYGLGFVLSPEDGRASCCHRRQGRKNFTTPAYWKRQGWF